MKKFEQFINESRNNGMILTNDSTWKGENVGDVKQYAREEGDKYGQVTKRKEIFLWNRFAKALMVNNKELVMNLWNKEGHNWSDFVEHLFDQLKDGRIKLEDLGEIEEKDNGSRGLASTMHMILWNKDKSAVLDAADMHTNRYYYL